MFEFTIREAELLNSFKDKLQTYVNKSYKFTMGYLASPSVSDYKDNERLVLIAVNKSVYQNLYSFLHLNENNMQYAAFSCLETALCGIRLYYALVTNPGNLHRYITESEFSLEEIETEQDKEEKEYSESEEQFSVRAFYDSLHLFNVFVRKTPAISSQLHNGNVYLGLACGKEISDELQDEVRKNLIGAYLSLNKHTKMFFNGGLDEELEDFEEEIYSMFKEYVKKFS